MEPRKLRTLLETLQAFGVTSYRDADVTVQLGAALAPAPDGDVDVPDGLKLPDGVPDVARALADIRKAYAPKNRRAAARWRRC